MPWELAGKFPKILDDEVVGESARSLYADATAMLERLVNTPAGKPEVGPKESFAEAVRRSFMPAAEKTRWLEYGAEDAAADPDLD